MATKVSPGMHSGPKPGDASGAGNGCCLMCCGKSPGPVRTAKITNDGGKFVTLEDGRVIEYFVYGSDKADAKVLIQQNGSMGTGWVLKQMDALRGPAKLTELNIKGISITRPGSAYSTLNLGCNLLYWAENDVGAVLEAEGVDRFFLEGISQGSGEAMAIAYAHHERVEKLHVIVPMLPVELSKEVMPHAVRCKNEPGGYPYYAKDMNSCKGCCCTGASCHVGVSCGCCCFKACMSAGSVEDAYTEKQIPGVANIQFADMKRLNKHNGGAFWLWGMGDEYGCAQWGFDLRDLASRIKGKDRVLVSFAVDDCSSHPDWGRYIVTLLDASYQIADGKAADPPCKNGHDFWTGRFANALFAEQLVQALQKPGQEEMNGPRCVNSYWDKVGPGPVAVPEGFSLEVKP